MEIFQGTDVEQIMCGRDYTVIKTSQNSLNVVGIGRLTEQPSVELEEGSFLMVCSYSDSIIYSLAGNIHRIQPNGAKSFVSTGPEVEAKEFRQAFPISRDQIAFLMREKSITPKNEAGCAALSIAQSSVASKYSIASEHPPQSTDNTVPATNPVMSNQVNERMEHKRVNQIGKIDIKRRGEASDANT